MSIVAPIIIDPVLDADEVARLLELRGAHGPYSFTLGVRTRYFRATYVYQREVLLPGIEFLVGNQGFADAARRLHGREVIAPAIVYANILVPGQWLEVHTDLPEYRGADRRNVPQWLLLAMQHSGLFERWRLPIATAILYAGGGRGGSFTYYPEGPAGPARRYLPRHNTALLIDVDTIFHGVDVVEGDDTMAGSFRPGVRLEPAGGDRWLAKPVDGSKTLAEYSADDLRYSVSWKAYCFTDEAERVVWQEHTDDLDVDRIKRILVEDLAHHAAPGTPAPATDDELRALLDAAYGTTSWHDTELERLGAR
jgi:hypothetical protein